MLISHITTNIDFVKPSLLRTFREAMKKKNIHPVYKHSQEQHATKNIQEYYNKEHPRECRQRTFKRITTKSNKGYSASRL